MLKINIDDTIAAIATPIGEAGIGIVRLSGPDALAIADKIFVSKDGKRPSQYETYSTHYGWIVEQKCHPESRLASSIWSGRRILRFFAPSGLRMTNERPIIDEVLLTVMRAPKSYTREDVVEINCHGGIVPLKEVLELVLRMGARPAEAGEFTKRAFLNGRIDLAQAEAVLDVVMAKGKKGLEAALLQLEGGLSGSIRGLKEKLLDVKVHLEASVDFPEEGLPTYFPVQMLSRLDAVKKEMGNFLMTFETGKFIREGINCVICGKANVGKSSLMNALLKEERVIVTPIPGTTRDAVSEYINIEGIAVNIVDTAGISKSADLLEREAVTKSRLWLAKADLVLFVLDTACGFLDEDREIVELLKDKEVICVINKIDLVGHMTVAPDELARYFGKRVSVVEVSVLKKLNIDTLIKEICAKVWRGEVFSGEANILTNARHKNALVKALGFVEEAAVSLRENQPEELTAISLGDAISALGELTGETVSEEVLERIFSQFCVGK